MRPIVGGARFGEVAMSRYANRMILDSLCDKEVQTYPKIASFLLEDT